MILFCTHNAHPTYESITYTTTSSPVSEVDENVHHIGTVKTWLTEIFVFAFQWQIKCRNASQTLLKICAC